MAKLDKCFDSGVQHCSETDLVRVNVLSTTLIFSLIDPELENVFVQYCTTQHRFFYIGGLYLAFTYNVANRVIIFFLGPVSSKL